MFLDRTLDACLPSSPRLRRRQVAGMTQSSFVIVLSLAVIVIIVELFLTSTPSFLTGL
jgi:hypothetical protein